MTEKRPEHREYKYNYITNVIFKIDFPKIPINNTSPLFSELQSALKERFPKFKEIPRKSLELNLENFKHTSYQEDLLVWEFKDKKNQTRVIIDETSLAFEHLKYQGFEEFYENIQFIIEKFGRNYPINKVSRLGLRYVNQIDINPPKKPLTWKNLIKKDLTCIPDKIMKNSKLSRLLHFLEIYEEDYRLRFQYGMYNSEYPNPISKKEFVLDYDCVTIDDLSVGEIINTTAKFHDIIYELFEDSIEDGLRGLLSDEEDEGL